MAMLITRFHRLIQNRLLWLGFLVVVVFSFVIWGTQMPGADAQGPRAAGTLDGDDISFEEYQRSRFNAYLSIVLMSGQAIPMSPELDEQLHDLTWERLATLREAGRLGIQSSNEEVVNAVQSFEFLRQNNQFSVEAYNQFARQFLAQFRATKREFEEHIRQEIILQKMRAIMDRLSLVTPVEIERTFHTFSDIFDIEYVRIPPSIVADNVKVSEEDVKAFFANEPGLFTRPEMVRVKAIAFRSTDYTDNLDISDAEIQEYYDFNLDDYAIETSEDTSTNEFSLLATEYRSLEDVKDEIRSRLASQQALLRAVEDANSFVEQIGRQKSGDRSSFVQLADEQGREVLTPQPFSDREIPDGFDDGGLAFTRSAFNLTDDDDYYYSDPVEGSNVVYVLALDEKLPPRIPEFDEVRDEATARAGEYAVFNALSEKAQEIHDSVVAGLSVGLSFNETIKEYGLDVSTPQSFSVNTVEESGIEPEVGQQLIRKVLVLNAGEVTDIVEVEDSMVIGYVKARTPSTEVTIDGMRSQIVATLRRQAAPVLFNSMQGHLLQRAGFIDHTRRAAPLVQDEGDIEPEG